MQLKIDTHSFIVTFFTGLLLASTPVLAHPKPLANPTCLTNSNHQVELCAVDLERACSKLFTEGKTPPECPTRRIKKREQYVPVCHVNSRTNPGTTSVVVTSTTITFIEVSTTTSTSATTSTTTPVVEETTTSTTETTPEAETTTSTTSTTTTEEPSTTSTPPTTTIPTTTEEPTTTTSTTTEVPPVTTVAPEPTCIADGQPCADPFRPDLCCGMACTIGGLPTPLCFSF